MMTEYNPDEFFGRTRKRVTDERGTLERIFSIMRRLILVPFDGDPIPRKGTTRKECYRALWEIQELLGTRMYFVEMNLPRTNADRIRQMSDEELADKACEYGMCPPPQYSGDYDCMERKTCRECWLDWLQQEVDDGGSD